MSSNPYSAPQAELDTSVGHVQTSIWTINGRLGVLAYWARTALLYIAMIVVFGAAGALGALLGESAGTAISIAIMAVGGLLFLYLGICMIVRRLHDLNRSGWWALLMLIPLVNLLFGLYALLVPGKPVANRFGPPHPTRGWEKVLGTLMLALYVVAMLGYGYLIATGGMEAMLPEEF